MTIKYKLLLSDRIFKDNLFKKKELDLTELNNYYLTIDNIGKYDFFFKTIKQYLSNLNFINQNIINFVQFFIQKNEYELTIISLIKLIRLKKYNSAVFFNLAVTYFKIRKYYLAKKYYLKANNFDQRKEQLLSDQAFIYNILRDKKKSKKFYYDLLNINKENYQAVLNLSKIGDKNDYEFLLSQYLDNENKDNKDLDALYFAFSYIFEELGDLNKSSKYIKLGNSNRKNKIFFNDNQVVNDINFFQKNKNFWQVDCSYQIDSKEILKKYKFIHIFILGLPRTGSTLLEQYLTSDNKFKSFGETNLFSRYFKFFFTKTNLKTIVNDRDEITNYSYFYNSQFTVSKNIKFIINKMPFNFYSIGFIKKCLPNSIIVLTKRNFEETGFSILKNYFSDLTLNFAYSEKDIIRYFEIYKDCILNWKKILNNNAFYEMSYEDIIQNPQDTLGNFFKFYNIDKKNGDFEINKEKILTDTASINQVDKGIYKTSLNIKNSYRENFKDFYKSLKDLNY